MAESESKETENLTEQTKVESTMAASTSTALKNENSNDSTVVGGDNASEDNQQEQSQPQAKNGESSSSLSLSSRIKNCGQRIVKLYWDNEFVCLVVLVILLARAYPPLGAEYLYPEITSTWIAVIFIFLMAGMGLKTEEFSKAFQRFTFNLYVQIFNFGVVSSIVFGISKKVLVPLNVVSRALGDGMVVCASLPLTINMVLVLTKSAGGDEASAIFNAAFGNLVGVFLSPILILGYLGVSGSIALWEVFYKLALRVLAPVIVGQVLQKTSRPVVAFVQRYKKHFKQAQQYCLVFIVYTVFCQTFADAKNRNDGGSDGGIKDIFIMIAIQFCFLCGFMVMDWYAMKCLFPTEPTLRVMGLFGGTHKTVAIGVPLINAIYEKDPLVGLYTLPLLIWHPMQLLLGSFLAPKLYAWVESEKERLGWPKDTDNSAQGDSGLNEQEPDEETGVEDAQKLETQPPNDLAITRDKDTNGSQRDDHDSMEDAEV